MPEALSETNGDGMNAEQAKKLREPFPPELIGQIPKGGVKLDYVGHAAVTDRLLQVDRDWFWEPIGHDESGRPLITENTGGMQGEPFGLWINLTVCGVTRPGFGGGKNAKECISDALRNAAMRFGVGLDLWSKEDLMVSDDGSPTSDTSSVISTLANFAQHEYIEAHIAELTSSDSSKDWRTLAETRAQRDFGHGIKNLTGPEADQLGEKLAEFLAKQPKVAAV